MCIFNVGIFQQKINLQEKILNLELHSLRFMNHCKEKKVQIAYEIYFFNSLVLKIDSNYVKNIYTYVAVSAS